LCTYLVDEVEGDNAFVSACFNVYLAPHTRVLPRAAGNSIDALKGALKKLREGVHVLSVDFPAIRNIYTRYFEIVLRAPR
jgi:hypothetical protein